MSGICAVIDFSRRAEALPDVRSMIDAAIHRAVDGSTHWAREDAALGHLALNITPEDEEERQPFLSGDGRYVIAADARVDNRDELLPTLIQDGLVASNSAGNAEIILAAYRKWGRDCISYMIGDFAFVVWDSVNRRVFGARDPMSMRPLFYRWDGRRLIIGSEVKQILAVPGVPKTLDRRMAAAWLNVGAGDPSWTFFDGVNQLPGAHTLEADGAGLSVVRGWDIDPENRIRYKTDDEYAGHFREILLEAARCRMRSRYPAGILLSGGLDSVSAAAASGWILRNDSPTPSWPSMTAFGYKYEFFPECDERHISRPLAEHFGFNHVDVPSSIMIDKPALEIPWEDDSPVVGMYRSMHEEVLRRAKEAGIRQLYSGARGDSMMGAYVWDHLGLMINGDWCEGVREIDRYRRAYGVSLSAAVRRTIGRSAVATASARSSGISWVVALRRSLNSRPSGESAPDWLLAHEPDVGRSAGAPEWAGIGPQRERYDAIQHGFTLLGHIANEQTCRRAGLQYEDLWGDRRIAEFASAVPQHILNRVNETKRLARMALVGLAPSDVLEQSRKIIPAKEGVHALSKRSEILHVAASNMCLADYGLVDEKAFRENAAKSFDSGEIDGEAWCAVTLEMWLRYKSM